MCKQGHLGADLRDPHERWNNAVNVSTSVGQSLLLACLLVESLQRLVEGFELQSSLLLCELQVHDIA